MYVELIRPIFIEQCPNGPIYELLFLLSKNKSKLTSKI